MELVNENELEEVSGGKGSWKDNYFNYTVVYGDTLSGLAMRFGTTINKLMMLNRDKITNPDEIKVGWEIKIPTSNKKGWI